MKSLNRAVLLAACAGSVALGLAATALPAQAAPASVVAAPANSDFSSWSLSRPAHPYVGSYTPGGMAGIDTFNTLTGVRSNTAMFFKNWVQHKKFDGTEYRKAHARGILPIVSWEPGRSGLVTTQPEYTLDSIIAGKHDAMISAWADGVRGLGFPIGMRFAHEMNGNWYPWATQANGGSPAKYVQAWKHVHDVFARRGATNVMWIWSPNVIRYTKSAPLSTMYPGDRYVDVVGPVGYGSHVGDTFESTYGATLRDIRTFTKRPFLLTEVGVGGGATDRAWLRSFFKELTKRPDIIGFVWFNEAKREDWRVNKTPGRLAAFRKGVASYVKDWKPARR